jgi:two-component system chemotaxis response regulator CheB
MREYADNISLERQEREVVLDKKLVILAASLGGPPLVNEILSSLAPSFELPLLVLQQMESDFSEPLTSAWGKTSAIRLSRLEDEVGIHEGFACVIPHNTYPQFESTNEILTVRSAALKDGIDFHEQWDMVIKECLQIFKSNLILILLTDCGLDKGIINVSLKNIAQAGGTVIRCKNNEFPEQCEDDEDGYLQMEIDQIIAFLQKISGGKYISV